ncbi:MAG: ester cyclase [Bryobacter sp.]|nr:ester cyclase [Bryobacter sp.]
MTESIKNIPLRWYEEGVNGGNLALIDELFDPEVSFRCPSRGEGKGIAAAKEYIAPIRKALPDLRVTVEDVLEKGDLVFVGWKVNAHHQGEFLGVAPTGKAVEMRGLTVLRVANGKIIEFYDHGDLLGMMNEMGAGPKAIAENKAIVVRYIEEFLNQQKFELAEEIFAKDYALHAPHMTPVRSALEMKRYHENVRASFRDLHFTIREMISEGAMVSARWDAGGTHAKEYLGIPASGKYVTWSGIELLRIADGKIAEEWGAIDTLGFLLQTGAVTMPAPAMV